MAAPQQWLGGNEVPYLVGDSGSRLPQFQKALSQELGMGCIARVDHRQYSYRNLLVRVHEVSAQIASANEFGIRTCCSFGHSNPAYPSDRYIPGFRADIILSEPGGPFDDLD